MNTVTDLNINSNSGESEQSKHIPAPLREAPKKKAGEHRENRFKANTVGFFDFNKLPDTKLDNHRVPLSAHQTSAQTANAPPARSRFAAYTTAEVQHSKIINDQIISALSEEAATNPDFAPKFNTIELAKMISKVVVALKLEPSKAENEASGGVKCNSQVMGEFAVENSALLAELKSTVDIQNGMVTELGKTLHRMTQHNSELVEANKKFLIERNNAIQARNDLLEIVTEANKREETKEVLKTSHCRQYFDETQILDAAIQEFRNQNRTQETPAEINAGSNQKELKEPNQKIGLTDMVKELMQLPPLIPIQIQLPNEERRMNRSIKPNTDRLFKNELRDWSKKVLEADSMEVYADLLKMRVKELSESLKNCLNELSQERMRSRQWRLTVSDGGRERNKKTRKGLK